MAVEHQLLSAIGLNEQRSAPAAHRFALRRPDCGACVLVQRKERGGGLAIAVLNDQITDNARAGRRPPGTREGSQVARPKMLTCRAIGVQAAAAKKRHDYLPVGRASCRCPAV